MIKIKIYNKTRTNSIVLRIEKPADAQQLMVILSNNDYPFVTYGDNGKEEE